VQASSSWLVLLSLKGRIAVGMDVGYDEIITASNNQFRMVGTYDLQKTASKKTCSGFGVYVKNGMNWSIHGCLE
jgi:hypothetical protein